MRHSTARISAAGAQRKRSQLLCEAKFISAARRFTPNRIHVPHRAKAGGSGETWDPARPRMISAASIQTPTANALAMRSLTGSRAWIPPQAARPTGAPSARAAWKAAMARKPAAAATATVICVPISAFFSWLTHLISRPRAHVMTRLHKSNQGRTSPSAMADCPAGSGDIGNRPEERRQPSIRGRKAPCRQGGRPASRLAAPRGAGCHDSAGPQERHASHHHARTGTYPVTLMLDECSALLLGRSAGFPLPAGYAWVPVQLAGSAGGRGGGGGGRGRA